jgi:hypothetical protein
MVAMDDMNCVRRSSARTLNAAATPPASTRKRVTPPRRAGCTPSSTEKTSADTRAMRESNRMLMSRAAAPMGITTPGTAACRTANAAPSITTPNDNPITNSARGRA